MMGKHVNQKWKERAGLLALLCLVFVCFFVFLLLSHVVSWVRRDT